MKTVISPHILGLLLASLFSVSPVALHAAESSPAASTPRQKTDPVFPPSLAGSTTTKGYTPEGKVDDVFVVDASHRAFAEASASALQTWLFDASPTRRREAVRFDFVSSGVIVSMTQRDATKELFAKLDGAMPATYPNSKLLDHPPARLSGRLPVYPASLSGNKIEGRATVSFFIDENGTVHVPLVTEASRAEFAEAALVAVQGWKFEPPLKKAQHVRVASTRELLFKPTP